MALARMRQSGAFLSTSEGLILQLVGDAAHPQFKEVLAPHPPPHPPWSPFSAPATWWLTAYIWEHSRLLPPGGRVLSPVNTVKGKGSCRWP